MSGISSIKYMVYHANIIYIPNTTLIAFDFLIITFLTPKVFEIIWL